MDEILGQFRKLADPIVNLRVTSPPSLDCWKNKDKRKVQGVPQAQAAALPRHEEEEETDKTKQAQIEQTYEKH